MNAVILVKDKNNHELLKITDMYWFEEEGFHNNNDNAWKSYEIVGMLFVSDAELKALEESQ